MVRHLMNLFLMKICRARSVSLCLIVVSCSFIVSPVGAQSLSNKLKSEPPTKLAADARAQGDPIRGAIFFNRKSIECGRCHASGGNQPLGPDLSQLFKTSNDEQLIESILNPDKVIKEGFESVTVVTLDGRVITGRPVAETDDYLVIRDAAAASTAITVARDDIDEISPSERSLMPSDLADQLANRQQFLDLVAYVIQLAERGPAQPLNTADTPTRDSLAADLQGRVMFERYRCQACHRDTFSSTLDTASLAPNLTWAGERLNPDYLMEFIQAPGKSHPHSRMPSLMHRLDEADRQTAAAAIVQFIVSQGEQQYEPPSVDLEAAERGRELYHSVGCVACHTPFDAQGKARVDDPFSSLGPLHRKYSLDGLIEFLETPHRARPDGRMPNMQLTHWESIDIANYLLQRDQSQSSTQTTEERFTPDSTLIDAGKEWFTKLECARCHGAPSQGPDIDEHDLKIAQQIFASQPIEDAEGGCLANKVSDCPDYDLTDVERRMIVAAIRSKDKELGQEAELEIRLSSLNCIACHQRNGLGGVAQRLDEYFQTTDQNLGQQGRIPPTLDLVGAKLNPDWMRDVLVNERSIRPYMKTRMPQFNVEEVSALIEMFQTLDHVPSVPKPPQVDDKAIRDAGLQLVGNQGLNCVACHTYRFEKSDTMPAVDLTEMGARLKHDWFVNYMRSPQAYSPNTVMPSFWPADHAVRADILDGDPQLQIHAIWQYLLEGRDARAPRGVVREPIELLATDEAIMLRRSYPSIGKRGIGVGYPGEVNLAFDAEQLRLGLIWKGPFAEASGVFRGQGSGNVNPLGRHRIEFAKGPELDSAEQPWVVDEGRPPDHQFEGYTLDAAQRPTFLYRYQDVQVQDFSFAVEGLRENEQAAIEQPADTMRALQRELSFTGKQPRDDLVFRVANGKEIEKLGDQLFRIDNRFMVQIETDFPIDVSSQESEQSLHVKLDITDKPSRLVVRYIW